MCLAIDIYTELGARVSGFTATKTTSKPYRKERETCSDPIEGESIHMCLSELRKAVPVLT